IRFHIYRLVARGPVQGVGEAILIESATDEATANETDVTAELMSLITLGTETIVVRDEAGLIVFATPCLRAVARVLSVTNPIAGAAFADGTPGRKAVLPVGITDTSGWTHADVVEALERTKRDHLDWDNTSGSARKWWSAFEEENKAKLPLVLRLAEELKA